MTIKKRIAFFWLLLGFASLAWAGFLRTDGKKIVNDDGEVLLRGIGLGGWMLQEGYMLQTQDFADAQHEIRDKIEALIGGEKTDAFYDAWLANYCRKVDVDSIAAWGFNSIRLPMHYNLFTLPIEQEPTPGENTWLDVGFTLLDSLLTWCAANEIYLILDLHAAPGGQGKDAAISDYDPSKPSLWESAENRAKTVALWRKIAGRYADEPWIGGYDLINEPNWELPGNAMLMQLYRDITAAIRSVDENHIIFIEGNWWGNDFTGLTPPWDGNMVYSFHKYWNNNDKEAIRWMLNIRSRYRIPIWCGEAGENSNVWFTEAISLLEANNIGWAWWPLKKVDSISGVISVVKPAAYDHLLDYWKGLVSKPSVGFATNALMGLAENYRLENCRINRDVIDAMFRQVRTTATLPFVEHSLPGVIFASDYDLGMNGYAYEDADVANYKVSTGISTTWNHGWRYRNDGVDIETCYDSKLSNGYSVGWIDAGEWLAYTVDVDSTAAYNVVFRTATEQSGALHLELDGMIVSPVVDISSTGGWRNWRDVAIDNVILQEGRHTLKVVFDEGPFNFNYMQFEPTAPADSAAFQCLVAESSEDGASVIASFNKKVAQPLPAAPGGFSIRINDSDAPISDYYADDSGYRVIFSLVRPIYYEDAAWLSYSGDAVKSVDGRALTPFTNLRIQNRQPARHAIPGQIQAEDFDVNNGFGLEGTSDVGGGQNLGWSDPGDYADYLVTVKQAGTYDVQYRIASMYGGRIDLILIDEAGTKKTLHSVSLPVTGGWQTWRTVSESAVLPQGRFTLRIHVRQGGFNLNWFAFQFVTAVEGRESLPGEFALAQNFPNPFNSATSISYRLPRETAITLKIINLRGEEVATLVHGRKNAGEHTEIWRADDFASGVYFVRMAAGNFIATKKLILQK